MNVKASLALHDKANASVEKLNYFLCGIAGALFAYVGQTYTPHKFDNWFYFLMPLSLLCLTLSLAFSLRIIKYANQIANIGIALASAFESCESINAQLKEHHESKTPIKSINVLTGEKLNFDELLALCKKTQDDAQVNKTKAMMIKKRADSYATLQSVSLIAGFVLILVSKILQPYFSK